MGRKKLTVTRPIAPRVSVLMPVFNTLRYVGDALASIQNQSFTDFELIVLDDGSTDGSTRILKEFAALEPRMRLLQQPNEGLIASRNRLLAEALGEFVAWMDSDDLSHPDRLMRQISAFEADDRLVCLGTNIMVVDPDGLPLGTEEYPQLHEAIRSQQMLGGGLRFPSTVVRRTHAMAAGGFRNPFRMGEDFDFLLRVAERGRIGNLAEFLYVYRQHLSSTCAAQGPNWSRYRDIILELASERLESGNDRLQRGEPVTLPETSSNETRKFVPIILVDWARRALNAGDRTRAFRYTLKAIWAAPFQQLAWRHLAKLILRRDKPRATNERGYAANSSANGV
jgi:GT2 family glycosyltransferase